MSSVLSERLTSSVVRCRGGYAPSQTKTSVSTFPAPSPLQQDRTMSKLRSSPPPTHSYPYEDPAKGSTMEDEGGREGGGVWGGRKPPDHTTKTWTQAYSFKPLAKQCSIARYTTSGQTVVNRSALHMASAGSLKKHNLFQTRSKTDTKACDRL